MPKTGKQYSFYLEPRHKYILGRLAKSAGWTEPAMIRKLIEVAGLRAGVTPPPEAQPRQPERAPTLEDPLGAGDA